MVPSGVITCAHVEEVVIADVVEDEVVALRAFGEVVLGVVDDVIRAERAHELHIAGAADAGHLGAERLGDLHGVCADAAGGAVDEHLLPGGDVTVIAQGPAAR